MNNTGCETVNACRRGIGPARLLACRRGNAAVELALVLPVLLTLLGRAGISL